MKRFAIVPAITFCAAFSGMVPAQADQTTQEGTQVTVSYGDLDLSRHTGAQVLIGRLEAAASKACGGEPHIRDLARNARYRACTRQAMDGAVANLSEPVVSQLYGTRREQIAEAGR